MTDQVGAVVVDFYTRAMTLDLVADLRDDDAVGEIVVVDNTGDAAYSAQWTALPPTTHLVVAPHRAGYGEGVNLGVHAVRDCSHVLILNSDVRLASGTVGLLVDALELRGLGAVAPVILDAHGVPQRDASGRFPDCTTHHEPPDWITGACVLTRTSLFHRVGGFAQEYVMYWEDVDFCRRLHAVGLRVGIDDALAVRHLAGGSPAGAVHRYELASAARERYLSTWRPGSLRIPVLRVASRAKLGWLKGRGR